MSDELVNLKEAAAILRSTPRTVNKLIAEGKLPASRISDRVVRIRKADVEALLPKKAS
jgi:excisionase family DNA binding protein